MDEETHQAGDRAVGGGANTKQLQTEDEDGGIIGLHLSPLDRLWPSVVSKTLSGLLCCVP